MFSFTILGCAEGGCTGLRKDFLPAFPHELSLGSLVHKCSVHGSQASLSLSAVWKLIKPKDVLCCLVVSSVAYLHKDASASISLIRGTGPKTADDPATVEGEEVNGRFCGASRAPVMAEGSPSPQLPTSLTVITMRGQHKAEYHSCRITSTQQTLPLSMLLSCSGSCHRLPCSPCPLGQLLIGSPPYCFPSNPTRLSSAATSCVF